MKHPQTIGFRDYLELIRGNKLTALMSVAMFSVMVVVASATASIVRDNTVHAYVAPRPTLEKVKIFSCVAHYDQCNTELEQEVNDWLKRNQSGMRIIDRQLTSSKFYIYLMIFYEVHEPQTPKAKPPAEAAPGK